MNKLEDLKIWEKGVDIAVNTYTLTESFPKHEVYGLQSQMRKAGVSIASNIGEGAGRGTKKDFSHFLDMSNGSANELRTQIEISIRLNYLTRQACESFITDLISLQRMIFGFRKSLNSQNMQEEIPNYDIATTTTDLPNYNEI